MSDTATKIERVELLELQNVNLRIVIVSKERDDAVKALIAKYGAFQHVTEDGTIVRAPTPLTAVPEGA